MEENIRPLVSYRPLTRRRLYSLCFDVGVGVGFDSHSGCCYASFARLMPPNEHFVIQSNPPIMVKKQQ